MQHPCLFCLEPVEQNSLRNPIGCRCKLHAHSSCFEHWFQQKQQLECPICHTISLPNAVAVENIRIVFVDTTQVRPPEQNRLFQGHEKAAAFCCCLLMGWSIGITILDLIVRS